MVQSSLLDERQPVVGADEVTTTRGQQSRRHCRSSVFLFVHIRRNHVYFRKTETNPAKFGPQRVKLRLRFVVVALLWQKDQGGFVVVANPKPILFPAN